MDEETAVEKVATGAKAVAKMGGGSATVILAARLVGCVLGARQFLARDSVPCTRIFGVDRGSCPRYRDAASRVHYRTALVATRG